MNAYTDDIEDLGGWADMTDEQLTALWRADCDRAAKNAGGFKGPFDPDAARKRIEAFIIGTTLQAWALQYRGLRLGI